MSISASDDKRSFCEAVAAGFAGLSKSQLDALWAHYQLLVTWNERLNLTRVVSAPEAAQIHYVESLFLGSVLPAGPLRIADVGSGGGFPGIPVAILRPECAVTLIESHQRKAVFLREASRGLPNVRVLSKRAQDLAEKFDWLVSRAVRPNDVLALRLAANVALLIGSADAGSAEAIPVPSSDRGVVAIWRSVPRGTRSADLLGRDKI